MRVRRVNVLRMIKRRALAASLPYSTCCHTFRGDEVLPLIWKREERSRKLKRSLLHESPRTTKLYDRTGDEITLDEVERIAI